MTREGLHRQHVTKWDRCADLVEYGILRQEWRDEVTTKMTACRHAPEGGQLS